MVADRSAWRSLSLYQHCDSNVRVVLPSSKATRLATGRSIPFSQRPAAWTGSGGFSVGVKGAGAWSCPFSSCAEVKNGWNCTVHPLPLYALSCTQIYLLLCWPAEAYDWSVSHLCCVGVWKGSGGFRVADTHVVCSFGCCVLYSRRPVVPRVWDPWSTLSEYFASGYLEVCLLLRLKE